MCHQNSTLNLKGVQLRHQLKPRRCTYRVTVYITHSAAVSSWPLSELLWCNHPALPIEHDFRWLHPAPWAFKHILLEWPHHTVVSHSNQNGVFATARLVSWQRRSVRITRQRRAGGQCQTWPDEHAQDAGGGGDFIHDGSCAVRVLL